MPIHSTFNFLPCSQPKSRHASPNHHRPTTMFHGLMDMLRSNTISISNPTSWPTIWVEPIYLCLVTKNYTFPIINDLIVISLSKPQACVNMFTTHKRLSLLHLCTQSNLSKHATMMSNNNLLVSDIPCFVVTDAIPSQHAVTRVIQRIFSWFARSFGWPYSLPLNLVPYILLQMRYIRLVHAH